MRGIESLGSKFDELSDRKVTVLNTIEGLGKLTPELKARIDSCDNLTELEDIYRPYKPKRETRGSKAVKAGLEPLMNFILTSPVGDLNEVAKNYICETIRLLKNVSKVLWIFLQREFPTTKDIENSLNLWLISLEYSKYPKLKIAKF